MSLKQQFRISRNKWTDSEFIQIHVHQSNALLKQHRENKIESMWASLHQPRGWNNIPILSYASFNVIFFLFNIIVIQQVVNKHLLCSAHVDQQIFSSSRKENFLTLWQGVNFVTLRTLTMSGVEEFCQTLLQSLKCDASANNYIPRICYLLLVEGSSIWPACSEPDGAAIRKPRHASGWSNEGLVTLRC